MKFKTQMKLGISTLAYHLLGRKVPTNVMLSVTDRCNSRCKYCGIPYRNKPELSFEEITALVDEMVDIGSSRICLWGGEPLVRSDIGDIIRYCKKAGLLTTMDSNGYLVPEKIEDVAELDVLLLSFDGPEEVHDKNREKGSYKKVMKALEVATKRLPVWTITVLTKNNLDKIDFILDKAEEFGIYTTWQVLHHQDLGSEDSKGMHPEKQDYLDAISYLLKRKKEGARIVNSTKYFEYLLKWGDFTKPFTKERMDLKCYGGKLYCNVDTDGLVYPCSVMIGNIPSLNIKDVGLKKAFDHISHVDCNSCSGGCYIEYNFIYSLDFSVINNWRGYTKW